MDKLNRYKTWIAQGKYKSFKTVARMVLLNVNGATVLEPLYKSDKKIMETHYIFHGFEIDGIYPNKEWLVWYWKWVTKN